MVRFRSARQRKASIKLDELLVVLRDQRAVFLRLPAFEVSHYEGAEAVILLALN